MIEAKLRHGVNPSLTWCVSNVAIERNQTGERKFAKRRSRIDGAVALLKCVGSAPQTPPAWGDIDSLVSFVTLD
jgi:phage terminase large subunit-like protein